MSEVMAPRRRTRALLGAAGVSGLQDARTVKLLRLGVGAVGTALPLALIAGNWLLGDKAIVPNSMSGSYYTSTRNLFVGALCALGGFLIGYRRTERQDRYTTVAGVCALLVAFSPTAPPFPKTEPTWISYLHHGAAGVLIFILGLFCLVVFAHDASGGWKRIYLISGAAVFAAGALALYTGIWPTSWSTGWPSLYLFEAVAVFAFGIAWITAALREQVD